MYTTNAVLACSCRCHLLTVVLLLLLLLLIYEFVVVTLAVVVMMMVMITTSTVATFTAVATAATTSSVIVDSSMMVVRVRRCCCRGRRFVDLEEQDVEAFLVDSSLWKLNLRLFLLSSVNDRRATDLGDFPLVTVERPHAYFVADDILDEKDAAVETERELVEELDVFQHVVVR